MTAPDTTADKVCGCRVGTGDVCARCGTPPAIPTATSPRPTPGSAAAELGQLRTDLRETRVDLDMLRRGLSRALGVEQHHDDHDDAYRLLVVGNRVKELAAVHAALNAAGASQGGSPAERIEKWAGAVAAMIAATHTALSDAGAPSVGECGGTPAVRVRLLEKLIAGYHSDVRDLQAALTAAGVPWPEAGPIERVRAWAMSGRGDELGLNLSVVCCEVNAEIDAAGIPEGGGLTDRVRTLMANYEDRIAIIGRGVVAANVALDAAGAPLGSTVAERIVRLADDRDIERVRCSRLAGVTDDLQRAVAAAQARANEADEDAAGFEGDLAALRLGLSRVLGVDEGYMNDEDLLTTVTLLTKRKPSPMLPSILALLDMRAKGDEALTHLVALLKGAM